MKYISTSEKAKLNPEELEKIVDTVEISNEAMAIVETINKGFERLRISNLQRK